MNHIKEQIYLFCAVVLIHLVSSCTRYVTMTELTEPFILPNGMHFVSIGVSNLLFCTTEVSNFQYTKFRPKHFTGNYHGYDLDSDNMPVANVDWNEAVLFCRWLNKKYRSAIPYGYEIRLPTENEWRDASRCGDLDRVLLWGKTFPVEHGNFADISYLRAFPSIKATLSYNPKSPNVTEYNDGFAVACDVKIAVTNRFGIHGMFGNVCEWCYAYPGSADQGESAVMDLGWSMGGESILYSIRGCNVAPCRFRKEDLGIRVVLVKQGAYLFRSYHEETLMRRRELNPDPHDWDDEDAIDEDDIDIDFQ